MEKSPEEINQIKVAIALKTIFNLYKSSSKDLNKEEDVVDSYEKIANSIDIRKATVNDIFNANLKSRIITLIPIVNILGYSMEEFGRYFDSVSEQEIIDFINSKKVNNK